MRLLYTASDGRFQWTRNYINNNEIPEYAILSHTWSDGQEVTFDGLKQINNSKSNDIPSSEGYQKLRFCAQQAERDGLGYFWVDTCCIDKSDSSELQEAINSMFRWYQHAARCYVYLPDVDHDILDEDGESAFKQSRWFTRGWTLQELLAPTSVEFFSKKGVRLGDKASLRHIIHGITGIPVDALHGSKITEFNVAERFSWTDNRRTTREEDAAYCLLGIFGVYMPLIYGEGKEHAIRRLKKVVHEASQDITGTSVADTQSGRQSQKERLGKICKWLSAPDPSTNYHKAIKQRQEGTGTWLIDGKQFRRWKTGVASRLWLHGIPGCGKTILSATIIENLLQYCGNDTRMVTAYFYFDFKDAQKRDPDLAIRSLLSQMLMRAGMIPKSIDELFASYENTGRLPPLHALLDVVRLTLQELGQVYIVIDALDESTYRPDLLDTVETIAGWQLDNLHILMTSRKERDIEDSLEKVVPEEHTICLQRKEVDNDIQRYIQHRLSDDKNLAKWNKDAAIRLEIEAALMSGAGGMFQWAVCQLDTLEKCRNRVMLRKALATLPKTLDQTYDYILSAITEEDADYALRVLQWLTFSEVPLSVEEMAEVVALEATRDPAFDRDEVLEDPLEVLNICSSLVTVTDLKEMAPHPPYEITTTRIVALAHYSVQEYLVSERIKLGPAKQYAMETVECQTSITKGCLKFLIQLPHPLSEEFVQESALARYIAGFWSHHLRKTGVEVEGMSRLAMDQLLSIDKPAYLTWLQISNPDWPGDEPDLGKGVENVAAPLYYASLLGLTTITKTFLDRGVDVNAQGGYHGNALQAASFKGHEQVVKMLLTSADVNAQGGFFGNALQAASSSGQERIVKMLLDANADVNAQSAPDGEFSNALQVASWGGYERVVELLLDNKAVVNAQNGYYGNALQAAAIKGHAQVVKILLDRGAKVNAQGGHYGTALQAASDGGHAQAVEILLSYKANVNAQGGYHGNALQAASRKGHAHIAQILLDSGADVNAQGGVCQTALSAASGRGSVQIVKMLLDRGADVDVWGGRYFNAMRAARLEGGMDWDTPVEEAPEGKYKEILGLLVARSKGQGGGKGSVVGSVRGGEDALVIRGAVDSHDSRRDQQERGLVIGPGSAVDGSGTLTAPSAKSHRLPQVLSRWLPTSRTNKLVNKAR